jgi:hypothetical protein
MSEKQEGKLCEAKTLSEILENRGIEPKQFLNPFLKDKFVEFAILDQAKADLISRICELCYWGNEGQCSGKNGAIYIKQPKDCPLRKIEKWFGEQQ